MKRLIVLTLVICLSGAVLALPAMAAEMRGLWVDAFHPGFKTPDETSALVITAKECNFNALFVQVRRRGDVYFRSGIEPMATDVVRGYDPLADVIAKAHAAGLEVHAWMNVYDICHNHKWAAIYPNQAHLSHPEWVCSDVNGKTVFPGDKVFLDPGVREVRDYLVTIAAELVGRYKVDGLHLDSIRYPLPECGYSETALARFAGETGRTDRPRVEDQQWKDWRTAQVTSLVGAIYTAVTKTRPSVKVSAAVYPVKDVASRRCFQDWAGWLDAGILDFAVPMVFDGSDEEFEHAVADCVSARGKRQVCIGHAGWKMGSEKSLGRIDTARQAGASGVVVYNYWYCSQATKKASSGLMKALKSGPFAKPDKAPAMPWKRAG